MTTIIFIIIIPKPNQDQARPGRLGLCQANPGQASQGMPGPRPCQARLGQARPGLAWPGPKPGQARPGQAGPGRARALSTVLCGGLGRPQANLAQAGSHFFFVSLLFFFRFLLFRRLRRDEAFLWYLHFLCFAAKNLQKKKSAAARGPLRPRGPDGAGGAEINFFFDPCPFSGQLAICGCSGSVFFFCALL